MNGKDYIIHFDHLTCQVSAGLPSVDNALTEKMLYIFIVSKSVKLLPVLTQIL